MKANKREVLPMSKFKNTKIASALAVAGVLSLGLTPGWASQQQTGGQVGQQMQRQALERPETIRQVQQKLNERGFQAGEVDGQMGPKTQSALREFQQATGLPATGQLDQQTLTQLGIDHQAALGTQQRTQQYGTQQQREGQLGTQQQRQQPGQQQYGQQFGQQPGQQQFGYQQHDPRWGTQQQWQQPGQQQYGQQFGYQQQHDPRWGMRQQYEQPGQQQYGQQFGHQPGEQRFGYQQQQQTGQEWQQHERRADQAGLSEDKVRQVQQKLKDQGYEIDRVDGQFDLKTQQALMNFQQTKGLQVTGQLDQQTLSELGVEAEAATEREQHQTGQQ
jgi:peptidoglycan hydrolase-like protein with peptidoglycan-binding domain